VYAVFTDEEQCAAAKTALAGKTLGERYIELLHATKAEIYACMGGAWHIRPDSGMRNVVQFKGLPFALSPSEMADWLREYGVRQQGACLCYMGGVQRHVAV
jgi:hypothetical protein